MGQRLPGSCLVDASQVGLPGDPASSEGEHRVKSEGLQVLIQLDTYMVPSTLWPPWSCRQQMAGHIPVAGRLPVEFLSLCSRTLCHPRRQCLIAAPAGHRSGSNNQALR